MIPIPLLAPAPPAAPLRAQLAEIAPPKGWTRASERDGRLQFVRPETPKGERLDLLVFPEESAPGDLAAWLKGQARELGLPPSEPRTAEGIVMVAGTHEKRPMLLAAVRPLGSKDRARLVAYIAEQELLSQYAEDFSALVQSLARRPSEADAKASADRAALAASLAAFPASDRTKPLPPADARGVKIFSMSEQVYRFDQGITFVWRTLLLFPDGTAFDDVPGDPIPEFTPEALRKAVDPTDAGRWAIQGETLVLTWPARRADERTRTLRGVGAGKVGAGWTADPKAKETDAQDVYRRVLPLTPEVLRGRWQASAYVSSQPLGGPLLFGGLSVATWSGKLAFEGDRYTDEAEGFEYTMGVSEARSRLKVAGRYRLDGPLLTREFGDGAGGFRRGIVVGYLVPGAPGDDSKVPHLAGRVWVPAAKE